MAQGTLSNLGRITRFGWIVNNVDEVWVFNGNGAPCPSAVFTTRERAETWINANGLQGMLTKYPLDVRVYDFAIQNGCFTPERVDQHSPEFIQRFTSASQEHYHYENEADTDADNAKQQPVERERRSASDLKQRFLAAATLTETLN